VLLPSAALSPALVAPSLLSSGCKAGCSGWPLRLLCLLCPVSSVSSVPCVFCALANSQPSSTNNLLSCLWSCVCIHTYTHVHTHTHTYTHTASCHFWMVSPPSQHPEPADVPHTLGRIKCAGHRRFQPLPCLAELAS
jgi:hypothetical protein